MPVSLIFSKEKRMDDFDLLAAYPGYYEEWERYEANEELREELNDGTAENAGYDPDELDDDELETVWEYGSL